MRAVTDNSYDKLLKRYTPAQLEQAKVGYEKAKEFIRRFVQAGGILKEGSDPPRGMAALLMHQALAMDVEAGVPPMKAIQAATLNVARTFKKDKDYGSVEPGKVADLVHRRGRPAARHLDDAKRQDGGHGRQGHRYRIYKDTRIRSRHSIPTRACRWTWKYRRCFSSRAPVPTTLKVRGQGGMWPFHRVMLNGQPLPTSFVSKDELKATIAPEAIPTRAPTSSRSSAKEKRFPSPIAPIWWWALSHSHSAIGVTVTEKTR